MLRWDGERENVGRAGDRVRVKDGELVFFQRCQTGWIPPDALAATFRCDERFTHTDSLCSGGKEQKHSRVRPARALSGGYFRPGDGEKCRRELRARKAWAHRSA